LRRTFTTLVTTASHDEFLAMRLIRDTVPGLSNRSIRYPLDQLVDALLKYSPSGRRIGLRWILEQPVHNNGTSKKFKRGGEKVKLLSTSVNVNHQGKWDTLKT
jgi:hypothetical protein